jgi:hypothetical protein
MEIENLIKEVRQYFGYLNVRLDRLGDSFKELSDRTLIEIRAIDYQLDKNRGRLN